MKKRTLHLKDISKWYLLTFYARSTLFSKGCPGCQHINNRDLEPRGPGVVFWHLSPELTGLMISFENKLNTWVTSAWVLYSSLPDIYWPLTENSKLRHAFISTHYSHFLRPTVGVTPGILRSWLKQKKRETWCHHMLEKSSSHLNHFTCGTREVLCVYFLG